MRFSFPIVISVIQLFFLLKAGHDFFYFQIGSAVAVLDVETQK